MRPSCSAEKNAPGPAVMNLSIVKGQACGPVLDPIVVRSLRLWGTQNRTDIMGRHEFRVRDVWLRE